MTPDLTTTNVLLGIMAVVSLLEAIAVVGAIASVFLIHRQVTRMVNGIEARQVAPAVARVNAILDDVKEVTSTVKQQAGRVDQLLGWLTRARTRGTHEQSTPDKIM